jgi:hypothetical protein
MKRRNAVPVCAKVVAMLVLGAATAFGQDFTAGKTPAQLFSSDCAECHRSPAGLAKNRDVRALSGFLREHYTTKADNATSLAAYVSGFTGSAPPSESRRGAAAARRAAEPEDEAHTAAAKPAADEQPARRRRAAGLSGDGEKHSGARGPANPGGAGRGLRETAALPPPAKPQPPRSAPQVARQEMSPVASGGSGDEAPPEKRATSVEESADLVERIKAYLISGQDLAALAADGRRHESAVAPAQAVPGQPSLGPTAPAANESTSVILSPSASAAAPTAPRRVNPAALASPPASPLSGEHQGTAEPAAAAAATAAPGNAADSPEVAAPNPAAVATSPAVASPAESAAMRSSSP